MEGYLLRKAEIEAYEGVQKVHFLNPRAKRTNKSLGDLTGLSTFGFHIIEVPVNAESTEFHMHFFEDECVYILEGQAKATIGKEVFDVFPGDFLGYRAGGLPHKLVNPGPDILKCIVVGARLAHDVGDYPKKKKRIFRNKGMAWNVVNVDGIDEPKAGKKV